MLHFAKTSDYILICMFFGLLLYVIMLRREIVNKRRHIETLISENERTEEILCQKREFLQILIESIPSPIYYKDAYGRYTGCNPAFEDFVGCRREEIIGKTVQDALPGEIADVHHQWDAELLETPGKRRFEFMCEGRDGRAHRFIFDKATLRDIRGAIRGTVGIITAITPNE